ncbi:hypothetical protein NK214_16830 [Chromobacterium sp. S0633]|uniref:hypothetical protein n=1 Tax=Chromobacterium sp. S0633 TaxID=2957805 RepID=UPI00209D6CB1|nr:hypothetical protein [Chromobacterium sp. S0633]MCP1291856.1 hypothetical protein [Chromobacterium sp. S0633]
MSLRSLSFLLALLAGVPWAAQASAINICYHYGCSRHAYVDISAKADAWLAARLSAANSPETERSAVSDAVTALYHIAARTLPIWQDKGGNFRDGPAEGRMDCVDHSSNVTAFLTYLQDHGWLQYHTVGKPAWRAPRLLDLHYTAVLRDLLSGQDWAVDSWFKDFGQAPVVLALDIWMEGYSP